MTTRIIVDTEDLLAAFEYTWPRRHGSDLTRGYLRWLIRELRQRAY